MKEGNAVIIAAYAGTGKTTTARLHPQTVVDFVCMPYKYYLKQDDDGESCKANPDNIIREDWPDNYVDAIKPIARGSQIILIPTDLNVLRLLRLEEIPYYLCYPERSAKETYWERFIDRGNTEDFIDIFIGRWDCFLSVLEQDDFGQHLVLRIDQYLDDVISGG